MESDGRLVYIYELHDPDTKMIKYVGRSMFPEKRLTKHLRDAKCHEHVNDGMDEKQI